MGLTGPFLGGTLVLGDGNERGWCTLGWRSLAGSRLHRLTCAQLCGADIEFDFEASPRARSLKNCTWIRVYGLCLSLLNVQWKGPQSYNLHRRRRARQPRQPTQSSHRLRPPRVVALFNIEAVIRKQDNEKVAAVSQPRNNFMALGASEKNRLAKAMIASYSMAAGPFLGTSEKV